MANFERYIGEINLRGEELIERILFDVMAQRKPYFIEDDQNYQEMLTELSNSFNVSADSIYVVGSGQLGFSLKNGCDFDQRYLEHKKKKFKSDIDVAIVSKDLFIELMKRSWKLTVRYSDHNKWTIRDKSRFCKKCNHPNANKLKDQVYSYDGLVCEKHFQNNQQQVDLGKLRNDKASFLQYLAIGWFRKDLAPKELILEDIEEGIKKLKEKYNRYISYAIYADLDFLREFQRESVRGYVQKRKLYDQITD